MSRTLATAALALAIGVMSAATCAGAAPAQKGVLGLGADPGKGVVNPGDGYRYTAIGVGAGTLITKLTTNGAVAERYNQLGRQLVVPAVAYDGSAGGLSADGDTLVLTKPGLRFPQAQSEFAVLDADRLRVRELVTLEGTFTFDALSPDGSKLYLIEYTSARDLTEYRVRSYDIERGRLDPSPIIDPDESGEDMYGTAVTRARAPSGRWEYTLYDGAEHPFVHALNTERGTAVCIDLDHLDRVVPGRTGLEPSPDGSTLSVIDRGESVASIDLTSFEVSEPASPGAPAAEAGADEDGTPWLPIAGGGLLLIAAGALIVLRRRRGEVDELELDRLVDLERAAREQDEAAEREPVR
jgi:LPXTG-motif cell wall-anchored protein